MFQEVLGLLSYEIIDVDGLCGTIFAFNELELFI